MSKKREQNRKLYTKNRLGTRNPKSLEWKLTGESKIAWLFSKLNWV